MNWKHHKMIAACTVALLLFSSHTGKQLSGLKISVAHSSLRSPVRHEAFYTIYLTFDDGPSAGSEIVNSFSESNELPINVFLIGRSVGLSRKGRELFREYGANPLVEIGNHSFSHAEHHYDKYYRDPSSVLADFNRTKDSLQLGNGLVRLPGRNFFRLDSVSRNDHSNGQEAADALAANGYRIFGWDLEWKRHPERGISLHTGIEMKEIADRQLSRGKTFLPGRLIILLHDKELTDPAFKAELENFVNLVKEDSNYCFGHLSEYGGQSHIFQH